MNTKKMVQIDQNIQFSAHYPNKDVFCANGSNSNKDNIIIKSSEKKCEIFHKKVEKSLNNSPEVEIDSIRSQSIFQHDISRDSTRSLKIEDVEWLTSIEAAALLGISVNALMNKVSNGKIPYFKFGRRNRYKKSELVALLSQIRKGPIYGN